MADTQHAQNSWTEDDSTVYQELAAVAVPARAEQLATLLTLLPYGRQERFRAVEVGCGEGALSYAILEAFPHATITALDGSEQMRTQTAGSLARFGARAQVAPFDLAATDWLAHTDGAGAVVSSLCVHHLSGEGKRRLFGNLATRLAPRGALLIADLVAPQRAEAGALFAATWDRAAERQSLAEAGSPAPFERFVATHWNYYLYPDPFDQPSPLFDQLTWLREAGFAVVDCFWLQAGHAIYGGYMQRAEAVDTAAAGVTFTEAMTIAEAALRATGAA
jgi:tRNA (cmo5U34)-methyltransferase